MLSQFCFFFWKGNWYPSILDWHRFISVCIGDAGQQDRVKKISWTGRPSLSWCHQISNQHHNSIVQKLGTITEYNTFVPCSSSMSKNKQWDGENIDIAPNTHRVIRVIICSLSSLGSQMRHWNSAGQINDVWIIWIIRRYLCSIKGQDKIWH